MSESQRARVMKRNQWCDGKKCNDGHADEVERNGPRERRSEREETKRKRAAKRKKNMLTFDQDEAKRQGVQTMEELRSVSGNPNERCMAAIRTFTSMAVVH